MQKYSKILKEKQMDSCKLGKDKSLRSQIPGMKRKSQQTIIFLLHNDDQTHDRKWGKWREKRKIQEEPARR